MQPRRLTTPRALGRHALAAALALTTGCTLLSGLSDLEVVDAPPGPEAGSGDAGATDGSAQVGHDGAATPDAPHEADGGDASTATVLCDGVECAGRCCLDGNQATCSGAASCLATALAELACDEPGDCAGDRVCCMAITTSPLRATCADSCAPIGSSLPLCRSPADCPSPFTRCEPLDREFPPNTGWGYCE
ncbi:MAG: hypothetical protein KF782_33015 [Labilithrix sp.]|nr:hypothetical protein [Labilithrix sp.]